MTSYACFDRPPFRTSYPAQDGWKSAGFLDRIPKMASVPFRMNFECQYRKTELGIVDPRCAGCNHRKDQ